MNGVKRGLPVADQWRTRLCFGSIVGQKLFCKSKKNISESKKNMSEGISVYPINIIEILYLPLFFGLNYVKYYNSQWFF